jgi:hypothetical protein
MLDKLASHGDVVAGTNWKNSAGALDETCFEVSATDGDWAMEGAEEGADRIGGPAEIKSITRALDGSAG